MPKSNRRLLKTLKVTLIILYIGFFVVLGASIDTLVGSVMGTMTAGPEPFKTSTSIDESGNQVITVSLIGRNRGMLETRMTLSISIMSPEGNIIAEGTDSKSIPAGSNSELLVRLTIPRSEVEKYALGGTQPSFKVVYECRTLFDLIGESIIIG